MSNLLLILKGKRKALIRDDSCGAILTFLRLSIILPAIRPSFLLFRGVLGLMLNLEDDVDSLFQLLPLIISIRFFPLGFSDWLLLFFLQVGLVLILVLLQHFLHKLLLVELSDNLKGPLSLPFFDQFCGSCSRKEEDEDRLEYRERCSQRQNYSIRVGEL